MPMRFKIAVIGAGDMGNEHGMRQVSAHGGINEEQFPTWARFRAAAGHWRPVNWPDLGHDSPLRLPCYRLCAET